MAESYMFCSAVGGSCFHIRRFDAVNPLCGLEPKKGVEDGPLKINADTLEHLHICKACLVAYRRNIESVPTPVTPTRARSSDAIRYDEIRFYRANEKPYGVFSNLYRCTVRLDGIDFPTAEHAYQAGKPAKPEVRDWILAAPTPSLCAMAAHGLYKWDVRPDWAKIKFRRMRDVLAAKFVQHEDLRKILLGTGAARLVEAGTTDNAVNRLWGEVNGRGTNMLGVLLMEVRNVLGGPLPCQCDGNGYVGLVAEIPEACRGCSNCKPPEPLPAKGRKIRNPGGGDAS